MAVETNLRDVARLDAWLLRVALDRLQRGSCAA
jgi:hypothetical protein